MITKEISLLPTYTTTPTITYSPSEFKYDIPNYLSNLTSDLLNYIREEKLTTQQILFSGKESRESLKESITINTDLDNELNSLRALILAQKVYVDVDEFVPMSQKRQSIIEKPVISLATSDMQRDSFPRYELEENQEEKIGIYTKVERQRKIRKYKEKLKRWRKLHPISRSFEGRRKVAFTKNRSNGRFSKQHKN